MATNASSARVTFYGRTLVNLIGTDGNFESSNSDFNFPTAWNSVYAMQGSIPSMVISNKYGKKAFRNTSTASDTSGLRFIQRLNTEKNTFIGRYYLYLVDVTTDSVGTASIEIINGASNAVYASSPTTNGSKTHYAKYAAAVDDAVQLRLSHKTPKGTVAWVQFEGARFYEIDAVTFAKIDVDPEYTGEKLAEKFPYVDGVKHVQGPAIKKTTRNIIPPFTDWNIHGNAVVNSPYSLTLNATGGNQYTWVDFPAFPGLTYSYGYTGSNGAVTSMWFLDPDGNTIPIANYYQKTAVAPAGTVRLRINLYANSAGTYTFDNPYGIINGSLTDVANTVFQPYNVDYIQLPTILASSQDGLIRDSAYEKEGYWYAWRKWKTGVVLDGSLAWQPGTFVDGDTELSVNYYNASAGAPYAWKDGYANVIKYTGKPLKLYNTNDKNNPYAFDNYHQGSAGSGDLYIKILKSEAGWGVNYQVTAADVKNYFNGWKLNLGDATLPYNNHPVKYWTPLVSPRANLLNKSIGSTIENPHVAKRTQTAYAGTTILTPSTFSGAGVVEFDSATYRSIFSSGDTVANSTTNVSGAISQQLFSFNLIEHILRKYGVAIFGSAVTTTDRVAWLKTNILKWTFNWYGYGSGPSGNKVYNTVWSKANNNWSVSGTSNHTDSKVAKLKTSSTGIINYLMDDGFIHFLAYADASDGTTACIVNTDFIDLEVVLNMTSIPSTGLATTEFTPYVLDYALTTPYEERITNAEGAVSLNVGNSYLELLEGIIVKEKVTPIKGSDNLWRINSSYNSANYSSYLKNKADFIVAIYKNGQLDLDWKIIRDLSFGSAYGVAYATYIGNNYDSTAEYSVTYCNRDKCSYTVNITEAKLEYQATTKNIVDTISQQIEDDRTMIGVNIKTLAELYKKVKALGG